MDIDIINQRLAAGDIDKSGMFPHAHQLSTQRTIFDHSFGLDELPKEPGILLIRGARQYGKSTWLEGELVKSYENYGPGSSFYLNGDFISNAQSLSEKLENIAVSFPQNAEVKRIFIDEITAIRDWETVLKRLVDNGVLRQVLVITTGSKATDLRRGAERLPGRKGKLDQTNFLFTPISYKSFVEASGGALKTKTLPAYLLSGGSPIACAELIETGRIPEYVIQLTRDWVEGEVTKTGRHRSALLNLMGVLCRFGGSPVGQAKLAREADLANNTTAQGYVELLHDLGCVIPSFPYDIQKKQLVLRKPCKYHLMNLLVAVAYHPAQLRCPEDFVRLSENEQGMWYEWLVAQELSRRSALRGKDILMPQAFWQTKEYEIDFVDYDERFIEVKKGKCSALEFSWFSRSLLGQSLTVINQNNFSTAHIKGVTLHDFLMGEE